MGKKEQSSDDEFMSIKESSLLGQREREDVFTRRMEACLEWITFN